jgi:acetoin utilization deacetylase AcuC-like enzyme
VHHGNGTQFIYWRRPDVLFCSIHADPNRTAPYYAGYADEIGEGPGKGLNINMPLPFGTDDATFLIHVDRAIRAAADFGAAAIVVSLGFDASEHDPHQTFKISNEGFAETARRIAGLGRPTLLVQEGGYLNPHLGTTLSGFLHAFDSVGKELA